LLLETEKSELFHNFNIIAESDNRSFEIRGEDT
jgi:hypothetical protein